MIAFARMNRILEIDLQNQRATVQPGVVNTDLTRAVEGDGFYFAPDPSSQKASTIGGNVAENAGGPHTLAYGVTTNHVTALELVLPDGEIVHVGTKQGDTSGYDLTALFVGSEGTLALVTEITVKLSRKAEAIKTLLAIFETVDDASETVADITARGITPAACEMMDGWTLRAVEEYIHAGFPLDSGAILLIEVEGLTEAVAAQSAAIDEVCRVASRARSARGARRERARVAVDGTQEFIRCVGPHRSWQLRAGRGHPTQQAASDLAPHSAAGRRKRVPHRQHFSRRRRKLCILLFCSTRVMPRNFSAPWTFRLKSSAIA